LLQTAHADSVEAWGPQPGPQTALVHCNAAEAFFGGARGGGKMDGVLGDPGTDQVDFKQALAGGRRRYAVA
jgi:hypothetical protein